MRFLVIFLLIGIQAFSQSFIQKIDGTKIPVVEGSIKVQPANKRLVYSFGSKDLKIKYKHLDFAVFDGMLFRTFREDNKVRGYFVLGESATKTLAAIAVTRSRPAGGFESTFVRYELAVFANNKLVESIVFTNEQSAKNTVLRADASAMIRSHFDCTPLIQRLDAFEFGNTEQQNDGISKFIDSKMYTSCK